MNRVNVMVMLVVIWADLGRFMEGSWDWAYK